MEENFVHPLRFEVAVTALEEFKAAEIELAKMAEFAYNDLGAPNQEHSARLCHILTGHKFNPFKTKKTMLRFIQLILRE